MLVPDRAVFGRFDLSENCCRRLLYPPLSRRAGELQNTEFQCLDDCLGAIRYA